MICLDTGPLIACLQEAARNPGHSDHREALLAFLATFTEPVIIPSIVLGEFLYGLPDELSEYKNGILGPRFRIAPVSGRAAVYARDFRVKLCGGKGERDAAKHWGTPLNAFRADYLVLGVARAEACTLLICDDGPLYACAKTVGVNACQLSDLPPLVKSGTLFGKK